MLFSSSPIWTESEGLVLILALKVIRDCRPDTEGQPHLDFSSQLVKLHDRSLLFLPTLASTEISQRLVHHRFGSSHGAGLLAQSL